jgi:hypothetical protein
MLEPVEMGRLLRLPGRLGRAIVPALDPEKQEQGFRVFIVLRAAIPLTVAPP